MHALDAQEGHRAFGFARLRPGRGAGAPVKDNIPESLKNLAASRTAKAVFAGPEGRRGQWQSAQSAGHGREGTKTLALTEMLSVISNGEKSFRQVGMRHRVESRVSFSPSRQTDAPAARWACRVPVPPFRHEPSCVFRRTPAARRAPAPRPRDANPIRRKGRRYERQSEDTPERPARQEPERPSRAP